MAGIEIQVDLAPDRIRVTDLRSSRWIDETVTTHFASPGALVANPSVLQGLLDRLLRTLAVRRRPWFLLSTHVQVETLGQPSPADIVLLRMILTRMGFSSIQIAGRDYPTLQVRE